MHLSGSNYITSFRAKQITNVDYNYLYDTYNVSGVRKLQTAMWGNSIVYNDVREHEPFPCSFRIT